MLRTRKLLLVAAAAVVLLAGAAAAAWWVPLTWQARVDRPVGELMAAGDPPAPGPWTAGYTEPEPGEATRSWKAPGGVEVDETIRRHSSPVWASLAYDRSDPSVERAEYFDLIVERTPPRPLPEADAARYFCGQVHGRPGTCDSWWVQLRYGQYVVDIQTVDVPSAESAEVPPWLAEFVRAADEALTSRT
ncbi:hypothetical protein [Saccharopolyspora taberi]|uniref:Uncharacterized protein n=1 Tax=Saccharopolyspora taberi TaxID=60895 RepID=A0ABN3VFZ7_9PSEU